MHLTPEDKLRDGSGWLAWTRVVGLTCLLALTGCASVQHDSPLPATVIAALQKAEMTDAVLGLVAYPLTDPGRGLRLNPDLPKQPGSTMKLVTTIVALERLGTNARGRTDMLATRPQFSLRMTADTPFEALVNDWLAVTYILNNLSRGLGQKDVAAVVDLEFSTGDPRGHGFTVPERGDPVVAAAPDEGWAADGREPFPGVMGPAGFELEVDAGRVPAIGPGYPGLHHRHQMPVVGVAVQPGRVEPRVEQGATTEVPFLGHEVLQLVQRV